MAGQRPGWGRPTCPAGRPHLDRGLQLLHPGLQEGLLLLQLPQQLLAGPLLHGVPELQCVLALHLAVILRLHEAVLEPVDLQLQVSVAHERGALLLALAGQAQGQVVVLVLAALELPAASLALLLEPLHTLLVLAQQAVLHPQLLDEVVLGAQQRRQVLHLLLQLHHLAHQQLCQARLPRRVNDHGEDAGGLLARDLLVQLRVVELQALEEGHVALVASPLQDVQEHAHFALADDQVGVAEHLLLVVRVQDLALPQVGRDARGVDDRDELHPEALQGAPALVLVLIVRHGTGAAGVGEGSWAGHHWLSRQPSRDAGLSARGGTCAAGRWPAWATPIQ